jgi:hypothetical protein
MLASLLDVCDGWRDRHDMRPDQGSLKSLNQIQDSNNMILRHILESPYPDSSNVRTHAVLLSPFISSCHEDPCSRSFGHSLITLW